MTRLGILLSAIACTCFITTAFADEKAGDKRRDGIAKRDGAKRDAIQRDGEKKRDDAERKGNGDKAKQADRPRDGKGQVDQRRGQGGQVEMIVRMLKAADKNKDGKISKEEAPERMKERFDRIDQNSDGFVDKEETAALIKRLREMMARQGDRPAGNAREDGKMRQRDGKGDRKADERKPRDGRADGRAKDANVENVKPKRPDAE